jgi:hypothetical protein
MVALNGRFLDRAAYAFDLAIGSGMLELGQPMYAILLQRISNIGVVYLAVEPPA